MKSMQTLDNCARRAWQGINLSGKRVCKWQDMNLSCKILKCFGNKGKYVIHVKPDFFVQIM